MIYSNTFHRILVHKIEDGQEIPGLRDSLVQIMHDYRLQVSLQEGCQKILVSDCFGLLQRKVRNHVRGLPIGSEDLCGVCNSRVVVAKVPTDSTTTGVNNKGRDVIVFRCRHSFHIECLASDGAQCGICYADDK